MEWGAQYVGMALVLAGGVFGYRMKKRKFDRTNANGIEHFPSFAGKLLAKLGDGILGFLSAGLLIGGILLLATYYEASWGWIVLVPVYAVILFGLIGM
jgi:hypothetical protein